MKLELITSSQAKHNEEIKELRLEINSLEDNVRQNSIFY